MITLYVKTNCPFSERAMAALDAFAVPFEMKNIADPGVEEELIRMGGRLQTPYLMDGDVHFYDSDRIIEFIESRYGKGGE